MKFIVGRDAKNSARKSYAWRLETDAGIVLAESSRIFDSKERCEAELENIRKGAASTKVIQREALEKPMSPRW